MKRLLYVPLLVMLALMPIAADATVTAFLSAGPDCSGASNTNFSAGSGTVVVSFCVTTTSESVCNASFRFLAANSGENGRFNVTGRTLAPAFGFSNLPTLAVPFAINNPASTAVNTTDYGAGTADNLPISPRSNILIATLTLAPQSTAMNATYILGLDAANAVVGIDQDANCGGVGNPPVDVPVAAAFTLNRAAPPTFSSIDTSTFTVTFPANFVVTANGTPLPTLIVAGVLPSGVSFTPATGVLGGTPAPGTVGSYPLTFTAANGNLPNATQSFTLTVQKANQAINFGALADRPYSATPFPVSATASPNAALSVTFISATSGTCTVSGTSVTMLATGTCTIVANQSGDGNYNPAATIPQSFLITGMGPYVVTPSAGANGSISPNMQVAVNSGATTIFTVTPNSGYVAVVGGSCGGSLAGTTYTTAAITGACTVSASFVALLTYNVVLEGAQEVPPNAATGSGFGTAVVNTVANTITLSPTFGGLTGSATAAHLHGPGARGAVAGVKFPIGTTSGATYVITYVEADEADILAGNWYVNIHTGAFPGGELRGQLDNTGFASKTLAVAVTGSGTGSVTGTGINCPGDCTETVAHNTMITLTAAAAISSTFTGWSGGGCSGTGTCTVTMNALKTVTATFTLKTYTVTPSAGANGAISPNTLQTVNYSATTIFTVTPSAGYNPNVGGTCGGNLAGNTYTTNPITANCTVDATFASSLSLVSVVSRKMHAALGPFEVVLDPNLAIGDAIPVEPRSIGAGHLIVFTFNNPVTVEGTVSVVDAVPAPVGAATLVRSGYEVQVTLTDIPDNKRVKISLTGVNGTTNASVALGFLVGDVTGSRSVNASDISAAKAHLNQTTGGTNFRFDVNVSGSISAADVSAIKARSGLVLP